MLIVCPDVMGLASMTGALSGQYSVLAAHGPDEALRLATRHGPCRLAYCEMGGDVPATLALTADLAKVCPGLAVIALVQPPCPDAVREAVANGRLQGVCLLPLSPEALRAKTRAVLAGSVRPSEPGRRHGCVLTREEVDFLLGRPASEKDAGCHPAS